MIEFTAIILAATQGDRLYPLTSSALDLETSVDIGIGVGDALSVSAADEVLSQNPAAAAATDTTDASLEKRSNVAIPKHLLPVGGDPILARLIRTLAISGFEKCIVLAGDGMQNGVESVVSKFKDSADKSLKGEKMVVEVIALPASCSGSADALRHLYSKKDESELEHIVVMPGDLVIEGNGIFGWLVDAHRRGSGEAIIQNKSSCTVLLSDVGENDTDGFPMKESAKAKKGGFAREEEEIEFVGVSKYRGVDRCRSNGDSFERLVFKLSKVDVEEDEDFIGKTPKLVLSKLKIIGSLGLSIRTDLMDLHVYVFAPWIRHLLLNRRKIISLQEDLVPLLISRQLSGAASCFGSSDGSIDLSDRPYMIGAQILPRGPRIAVRCCTISSYLFACREIVGHAVEFPEKMIAQGFCKNFTIPLESTFLALDGSVQSKNNSLIQEGSELPEKITIKNSTVGRKTKIGEKCKLNNVVIMDNVTIGNETILQNTVVSEGAVIMNNCNLNDCQVGLFAEVPALTKVKGEAIVK